MPEGPEIRQAADKLNDVLAGKIIESAAFTLPSLSRVGDKLIGRTVLQVTSRFPGNQLSPGIAVQRNHR